MMKNIIGTDSFNEIKDVLLKKKCPSSGCPDGIPKSNAWIVWLSDKNGKITSMEV